MEILEQVILDWLLQSEYFVEYNTRIDSKSFVLRIRAVIFIKLISAPFCFFNLRSKLVII